MTEQETYPRVVFGFWVYLMSDCILFATLFATFAVLNQRSFGDNLPYALTETLILLTSSFACGLAGLAARNNEKNKVIAWFTIVFLLGLSFVVMELREFAQLVQEGNSWQRNASFSAFFTLVGTHGIHISVGLLWMLVLISQIVRHGLSNVSLRRLACLRLFWHFLDIVWIFIFTFVYLLGGK